MALFHYLATGGLLPIWDTKRWWHFQYTVCTVNIQSSNMWLFPENLLLTDTGLFLRAGPTGIWLLCYVCQITWPLFHLIRVTGPVPTDELLDIRIKRIYVYLPQDGGITGWQHFRQITSIQYFSKGLKEGTEAMFLKLAGDTKLAKTASTWKKEFRIILHWSIQEIS